MARHDIRGIQSKDGTYLLSAKDIYNTNDNFIQLSHEIFGNSSFTKKIEKRVTDVETDILLKVSSTDFNGTKIASLINLSTEAIKIQAPHIQLEGIVTANTNFKILADGSIEGKNAKLSGSITATKMVAPGYTTYFGEIGVSGGSIGFGLFDTRYNSEAFCEILELENGAGFSIRDVLNRTRFEAAVSKTVVYDTNGVARFYASPTGTLLRDENNVARFYTSPTGTFISDKNEKPIISATDTSRFMISPDGKNYVTVSDSAVKIVKNGVVVASW